MQPEVTIIEGPTFVPARPPGNDTFPPGGCFDSTRLVVDVDRFGPRMLDMGMVRHRERPLLRVCVQQEAPDPTEPEPDPMHGREINHPDGGEVRRRYEFYYRTGYPARLVVTQRTPEGHMVMEPFPMPEAQPPEPEPEPDGGE